MIGSRTKRCRRGCCRARERYSGAMTLPVRWTLGRSNRWRSLTRCIRSLLRRGCSPKSAELFPQLTGFRMKAAMFGFRMMTIGEQQEKEVRLTRDEVITMAKEVASKKGDSAQIATIRQNTRGLMGESMRDYWPEFENLHSMKGFASHHPEEVPDPEQLLQQSLIDANLYRWQGNYGK